MSPQLAELVDIPKLKALLDSLHQASGIPTAIIDNDGNILAGAGWQPLCMEFHRTQPDAEKICIESNRHVAEVIGRTGNIYRYSCPHGLTDGAMAIIVGGEHLGNAHAGQVFLASPDEESFRARAGQFGFDEHAYLTALRKVPIVSQEQIDSTLLHIAGLTEMIAETTLTNRREQNRIAQLDTLSRRYGNILETTSDGFWILDGEGRCLEATPALCAMFGYTLEELRGMAIRDFEACESPAETAEHISRIKRDGFGRFETCHRRKDGTVLEVEINTTYSAAEDLFVAFIRDITERKRTEEALRTSEQMSAALSRVSQVFLCAGNDEEMYDQVLQSVLEMTASPLGVFGYLDDSGALVCPSMTREIWSQCQMSHKTIVFPQSAWGESSWGKVLRTGSAMYANSPFPVPEGHLSIHRCLMVPLVSQGASIGLFIVANRKFDYTDRDRNTLQQIADYVAPILSARLIQQKTFTELRERENRLRVIFETAKSAMMHITPTGTISFANQYTAEMFDDAMERIIGLRYPDIVHPDQRESAEERMRQILSGEIDHVLSERMYLRRDGSDFWGLVSVRRHEDGQGELVCLVVMITDITERKQAEEALRESFQRTREIVQAIPSGLFIYQFTEPDQLHLLEGNQAAWQLTGLATDEAVGLEFNELWPAARAAGIFDAYLQVMRSGTPFQTEDFSYQDGRLEGAFAIRVFRMSGNRLGVAFENITKRKEAEQRLQENRERLQFLLTTTPAVIYTCKASGDYGATFVSDNVRALVGYAPHEFLVDPGFWLQHIHPEDRTSVLEGLSRIFEHGEHAHEYRFLTQSGGYRWLHDEINLVRDAAGRPVECIGFLMDVTDRKQAELNIRLLNDQLELRVAERTAELVASNSELESFCYTISHDLRAPLRAIDGFTRILLEDHCKHLPGEALQLCGRISSNAVRMGQMTDELLTFSRLGRAEFRFQPVNMSDLVRGVIDELVEELEGGPIHVTLRDLPAAVGDVATLRQVWSNLIGNALKYSATRTRPEIDVRGEETEEGMVYHVQDNGVGFDMSYAGKLFGVFQRLHSASEFSGTGVGLAIVQRIVHRHGGTIWAEGKINQGATFSFSLPRRGSDPVPGP